MERISSYLGCSRDRIDDELKRAAMMSVADTAIIPLQDLLNLGSEARMNIPGTPEGNWSWRFKAELLTEQLAADLHSMLALYGRSSQGRYQEN